jgi:hypothetical protein
MRHRDWVLGITIAVLGGAGFCGCQAPATDAPSLGSGTVPARLAAAPSSVDELPQFGSDAPADPGISTGGVLAPYQPPPKRAEIPPPATSPQSLWVGGHWHWSWSSGRYVWSPGRYIERPQPDANWLPGYWEHRAVGWIWVEGRWT